MTITETAAPSRTRTWFRIIAIAEALSWLALLIAMGFKWLPETNNDHAVRIPGMIHGGVFMIYVGMCFFAWWKFKWTPKTAAFALASAIPPFLTYVFEVLADRRGLLGRKVDPRAV